LKESNSPMARKLHRLLNAALPRGVRSLGRRLALASIPTMRHLDMMTRLRHVASLGFQPSVIHDIGSATGQWAREAVTVWPNAKIFGFEPNASQRPALEATRRDVPNFDYRQCFLGPRHDVVKYNDRGTGTTLLTTDPTSDSEAEMLVLDELIGDGSIPPPDLIKIDVQGFELEVLRGGEEAMRHAQGLLMEVNFWDSRPGIATFDQVLDFCRDRGFMLFDFLGILRRPYDDLLWQMDALLLRHDHPLRGDPKYH